MAKRLLTAALAAYTIVVVSGAPLPLATVAAWCLPAVPQGAGAQRFPCEACPCGCGTAEHCWNDCCCHTLPQRLAWARREGVRPPESAIDSAERAGLEVSSWREARRFGVRLPAPIEAPAEQEVDLADLPPEGAAGRGETDRLLRGSRVRRPRNGRGRTRQARRGVAQCPGLPGFGRGLARARRSAVGGLARTD